MRISASVIAGGATTFTCAAPLLAGSSTLVAVTVNEPAVGPAVYVMELPVAT
jgi:hypothetical protein